MKKSKLSPWVYLIVALLSLCGCDDPKSSQAVDDLKRSVKEIQDSVTGSIAPAAREVQNLASGEVDKLFSIEYKVVQIPDNAPANTLEVTLAQLGADRWECFSILERAGATVISCHRRPTSYLRWVLKFFPIPLP
ncbi:MAG: hypothetical protein K1X79_09160 [Oligoflexia bacterium]|nr:hypothetical protein [Oligoflexia bacterium]